MSRTRRDVSQLVVLLWGNWAGYSLGEELHVAQDRIDWNAQFMRGGDEGVVRDRS